MKQGDFSALAKAYINRPGYSRRLLELIGGFETEDRNTIKVADVGAGTGKLTENLCELGFTVDAVEPNDNMREEGILYTSGMSTNWSKGSGEETGLEANTYNWVLMGSSFHWVDFEKGTQEFHRILKQGGKFTAIWNPRNIRSSELHSKIEDDIFKIAPNIKRKSSGSSGVTENLTRMLNDSPLFEDCIFAETEYDLEIPKERYMGAWHSTNDIQAQAGPEKWKEIIDSIEDSLGDLDIVRVPYKTRAWTALVKK